VARPCHCIPESVATFSSVILSLPLFYGKSFPRGDIIVCNLGAHFFFRFSGNITPKNFGRSTNCMTLAKFHKIETVLLSLSTLFIVSEKILS
jgi:hypothetical protein